ncbi:MAG: peptidylprolyl isomerase [Caldilineaceae bacterium]|nr:peptidylprolyl isomerase [Caldilineaceae bacterium]
MRAKEGNTVLVHYTGTLEDGTEFDSSTGREPLQFTLGTGHVIPGFERGVLDMAVGESKRVEIPVKEAYGEHHPELVMDVRRTKVPAEVELKLGSELQMKQGDKSFVVRVVELTPDSVRLDGNHPLAGKKLTFEIEVVDIR